jgi:NAD-dependent dihydropyrimidine dehydrogenase PreA subunit
MEMRELGSSRIAIDIFGKLRENPAMIIFSRNRSETAFDTEIAESTATRFNTPVLSIPFFYDLRSFGSTIRRLQSLDEPGLFLAPFPERASKNLLAHLGIQKIVAVMDISDANSDRIFKFIEAAGSLWKSGQNGKVERLEEMTVRRWYPVIDQKECIGCLECVNFCLFGVYVIGKNDKPVTDQPDACRDGCPACARVCPGAAIMFPLHTDPDLSGQTDPETVRKKIKTNPAQAEEERKRQISTENDWVEQVDQFDYQEF